MVKLQVQEERKRIVKSSFLYRNSPLAVTFALLEGDDVGMLGGADGDDEDGDDGEDGDEAVGVHLAVATLLAAT